MKEHKEHEKYEMDDFEKMMALDWGSPKGLAILLASVSIFLLSIGLFILILHYAHLF